MSLEGAQSAVRSALAANDWLCGMSARTCRAGLVGARLQHLVSATKNSTVAVPYKGSAGPLHLLIDSTGIKAEGEGEWNARKHGGPKRRLWRKIYIGIDEQTLEIRAIEVTSSSIGDAHILPNLLNQIPPCQDLGSVTAPSHACKHALPGNGRGLRHPQMP